jgi:pantoate--beta-alanine ligase
VKIVTLMDEVRVAVREGRAQGHRIGLVPTMGALHAGHLCLIRQAVQDTGFVVVTNYVNPVQFGPQEDFESYPRTMDADNALCRQARVAVVYAPRTEELYPPGHATWVEVTGLSDVLEGRSRPGHFRGVATIVAKLFNIVQPDVAFFGRKDAQQLAVIRRLVRDLCLPVQIVEVPTVRDADGLALSSRNRNLSPAERKDALCLVQALREAEALVATGHRDAGTILDRMRTVVAAAPSAVLDYVTVADPDTFLDKTRVEGPTVIAIAARFGATRLIDNVRLNG